MVKECQANIFKPSRTLITSGLHHLNVLYKRYSMAAPSLDNEFLQYWSKLSIAEKESLITVAKNYVQLKDEENVTDIRKKLIQAERESYLKGGGQAFSWQQVKDMALDKKQRNAL
jgi:hypothetical protein